MDVMINKSPPEINTQHLKLSERLFINEDGTPISFNVGPSPDRDLIVQLIKAGGGAVTDEDSLPSSGGLAIASGSRPMQGPEGVISSSYIYTSVFNGQLMDVADFRFIPDNERADTPVKINGEPHDADSSETMISMEDVHNILEYLIKYDQLWKEIEKDKVCGNKSWKTIQHSFSVWASKLPHHLMLSNSEKICGTSLQDNAGLPKNGCLVNSCYQTSTTHSHAKPGDELASNIGEVRHILKKGRGGAHLGLQTSSGYSAVTKDDFCEKKENDSEENEDICLYSQKKQVTGRTSAIIDDDSASEHEVCEMRPECGEREDVLACVQNNCEKEASQLETDGKSELEIVAPEDKINEGRDYFQVAHCSKSTTPEKEMKKFTRKQLLPVYDSCNVWLGKLDLPNEWKRTHFAASTPVAGPSSSQNNASDVEESDSDENEPESSPVNSKKKIPYHQRLYSHKEDMEILKWLCYKRKRENDPLRGNRLWKFMESRKVIPGRSWQSLRNRFLKHLAPNLKNYPIPQLKMKKLLREMRN